MAASILMTLWLCVLTDVGVVTIKILEVADLDSCLWRTSPLTYLIAWVAVFILMKPQGQRF